MKYIEEIIPGFWHTISLPYNEHELMEFMRIIDFSLNPSALSYRNYYNSLIEYVSVTISAENNGKLQTASSSDDSLTLAQKKILSAIDNGANVIVKIKFRYRYPKNERHPDENKLTEGLLNITAVPTTEAIFTHGNHRIEDYFTESVKERIHKKDMNQKLQNAVLKFTVNESGKVENVELKKTSADSQVDKVLLNAAKNMPAWIPAVDEKGAKVKQVFIVDLGGGGC